MYRKLSEVMVQIISEALSNTEIIKIRDKYKRLYRNKEKYSIDIYPVKYLSPFTIKRKFTYFPYLLDEFNNIVEKNLNVEKKIIIVSKMITVDMMIILFSRLFPPELICTIIHFRTGEPFGDILFKKSLFLL